LSEAGHFDYIRRIPRRALCDKACDIYFDELLSNSKSWENNCKIVDKLPLNILNLPVINYMFPNAKIILVLRHPLDAILSNWMQLYQPNLTMAHMLEVRQTVELYCTTMTYLLECWKKLDLNIHVIKYENVVSDMKNEVDSLLRFLDLTWENQMYDYQSSALKKGIINTPSYSQVVRPIYSTSTYKWLKYRDVIGKYIGQIEPWLEQFNYSIDHD